MGKSLAKRIKEKKLRPEPPKVEPPARRRKPAKKVEDLVLSETEDAGAIPGFLP